MGLDEDSGHEVLARWFVGFFRFGGQLRGGERVRGGVPSSGFFFGGSETGRSDSAGQGRGTKSREERTNEAHLTCLARCSLRVKTMEQSPKPVQTNMTGGDWEHCRFGGTSMCCCWDAARREGERGGGGSSFMVTDERGMVLLWSRC